MERSKRSSRRHFMFSGLTETDREELRRQINHLGGIYSDTDKFLNTCTHIICGKPSRGEKFLGGLATGKWILTKDFVTQSYKVGKWLEEGFYEWKKDKTKLVTNETLKGYLHAPQKWRLKYHEISRGAFLCWRAAVLVDHVQKKTVYKRLLEAGGATLIEVKLPVIEPAEIAGNVSHVFADRNNMAHLGALIKQGVSCVDPVFIGDYLLKESMPHVRSYIPTNITTSDGLEEISLSQESQKTISSSPRLCVKKTSPQTGRKRLISSVENNFVKKESPLVDENYKIEDSSPHSQKVPTKKRTIQDADIFEALNVMKRQKLDSFSTLCQPACQHIPYTENREAVGKSPDVLHVQLSDAITEMFISCLDEGMLHQALDFALSSISTKRYPPPKMLHAIYKEVIQESISSEICAKAMNILRRVLYLHPPKTPALQQLYLQSFCSGGQAESQPGEIWAWIDNIIVMSEGDREEIAVDAMKKQCHLMLFQFFIAILEKDFQIFFIRKNAENSKKLLKKTLIAQLLWPDGDIGKFNPTMKNLIDKMLRNLRRQQQNANFMKLLKSLLTMIAECCLLADNPKEIQWENLGNKVTVYANELAYRIHGEFSDSPKLLQHALDFLQPVWLTMKVTLVLLDLLDDSLLPEEFEGNENINLKKIVSRYFYLLPPLSQTVAASPHKKSVTRSQANALKLIATANQVKQPAVLQIEVPEKKKIGNVNKRNIRGETPLHVACIKNNLARLKELLLVTGIDVNATDNAGWTPLHEACNHGNIACVKELLKFKPTRTISMFFSPEKAPSHKLDLLAANEEGITALHDAVQNNHVEVVKLLVKQGGEAILKAKTIEGKIPLDFAWTDEVKAALCEFGNSKIQVARKRRFLCSLNSSQDSQCNLQALNETSHPPEEAYTEVLGTENITRYATRKEIVKYVVLVCNLVKSYIKFKDLNCLQFALNNLCEDGDATVSPGPEIMTLRTKTVSEISQNNVEIMNTKNILQQKNPKENNLTMVKEDLEILKSLRVHIKSFESHLNHITENQDLSECKFQLLALKCLAL